MRHNEAMTPLSPVSPRVDGDPIHADFSVAVTVDTTQLPWQPSPSLGVERRRLEWVGTEPAPQLTTVVRFAPGSSFSAHTHDNGEEIVVLSGVFSDHHGDHVQGSYLRNPPGSRHAPHTTPGCLLLVKLRQFQAGDQARVALPIQAAEALVPHDSWPACWVRPLHAWGDERVYGLKLAPDGPAIAASFAHGLELFVLEGELLVDGVAHTAGHWLRRPPGARLSLRSLCGALLWVKEGPASRYA